MSVREQFDEWARSGRDRGMEERHWQTAKHALRRLPAEPGDTVLDLGTGSGYALRALRETKGIGRGYGIDASPEMVRNARDYTDDPNLSFLLGDFERLPFESDSVQHVFSMEAFYYANDPETVLEEIQRVLVPGGTFYCAVNYYAENVHSQDWGEFMEVELTRWDAARYRRAFREAGLAVAGQDNVPDRDVEIPPESEFPTEEWDSREAMIERYRTFGTLLTVGVSTSERRA
jgi:SAM-dependent methyltransferase